MIFTTQLPDDLVADAAKGANFDPARGLTHQQWVAAATANFVRQCVLTGSSQRAAVTIRSDLAAKEQLTPISSTIV